MGRKSRIKKERRMLALQQAQPVQAKSSEPVRRIVRPQRTWSDLVRFLKHEDDKQEQKKNDSLFTTGNNIRPILLNEL